MKLKHDLILRISGSNFSFKRSDLLTTKIASFFNKSFKKPLKSMLLASTTTNFKSAFSAFLRDNLFLFFLFHLLSLLYLQYLK